MTLNMYVYCYWANTLWWNFLNTSITSSPSNIYLISPWPWPQYCRLYGVQYVQTAILWSAQLETEIRYKPADFCFRSISVLSAIQLLTFKLVNFALYLKTVNQTPRSLLCSIIRAPHQNLSVRRHFLFDAITRTVLDTVRPYCMYR